MRTVEARHLPVVVPEDLAATEPPEARGLERDEVRLLVAEPGRLEHAGFKDLGEFLRPGDLVVVNTSATIPAAIDGERNGRPVTIHLSSVLEEGEWLIELRSAGGSEPILDGRAGEALALEGGGTIEILSASGIEGRSRMLKARVRVDGDLYEYLARIGRPISYPYVSSRWALSTYQTIFAREPGSAEMPSASRPFSQKLVTDLVTRGVVFAPLVLHTGVSSLEKDESPLPERFNVPKWTARFVNSAKAGGRRVIAAGTTVTRALETAAEGSGFVRPGGGWTDLVLGPDRPSRVVDGLITGWHAPEASHQKLLTAVAGTELVNDAYIEAIDAGYLWHEFGDVCLFLP